MALSAAETFAEISSTAPPSGPAARIGTALVLGGSVAGMLAARVLAEHAGAVVVIERDLATAQAGPRPGVPQGGQVHVLLGAGLRQLERWFPGFTERAVAAGAGLVTPERGRAYNDDVPKVQGSADAMLTSTRPFLEQLIRTELRALPNVKMIAGRVTGLEFDDTAVTAVRYESDGVAGREPADLVVDALGRASRVSDWLEAAGWDRPPMTRLATGVNYATAFFRRPPGEPEIGSALALYGTGRGGSTGGAIFLAVEDDRYVVMQGGYGDDRPGSTAQDMVERCRRRLPEPFGHVVANEMLGDVTTYRQGDSRRRDFDACERLPARLIPVGDAVASFNPLYGQGMSSAALHASALSMYLRSEPDLSVPARDFLALQKVVVDAAWAISTPGDAARAAGAARPSIGQRLAGWFVGRVVDASVTDLEVNRVFMEVTQMLVHPTRLREPATLWRAVRAMRQRKPDPVLPLER